MNNHHLRYGPILLDTHTRELFKDGEKIKLSGQPLEILALLLRNPGRLVTREELRNLLWPRDTFVDFDHGLNAAIAKLREALCDSPDDPRFIETLPRRGYRWIAVSPSHPAEIPAALPKPVQSKPFYRDHVFIASLVFALLLPATFLLSRVSSSNTRQPLPHIQPLTNLPGETSDPAFSPSGDLVAFHRDAPDRFSSGIFMQSISTGASTQLTHNEKDYSPVFSPDGQSLAFARSNSDNPDLSLFLISIAAPAAEGHIYTPLPAKRAELAFSPDGRSLAYTAASGLVLLFLQNSALRQITEAPPQSQDWGPSFSPDGSTLLFVRSSEAGFTDQLLSIPVLGGEPTQIASEHARILGPPQWSADGQSVIFASGRGSHPGLWRVSAHYRDTPVQINDSGWHPAISHATSRLAYQRITRSLNIWEVDPGSNPAPPRILVPATSETDQGPAPQISPDGTKLAYMSDRSGTMEIWVSDRDGSRARQLTAIGNVGTPRWSPDSRSIVFDAERTRGGAGIYTVSLDGASPRPLTPEFHNVCPSYSRDGQWIYFASWRTGQSQVWKIPAAGGNAVQVTHHGGHAALASADGKFIYYAKTFLANPEIWQVPVNGVRETLVSPKIRPPSWAAWAVVDRGIVFAASSGQGRPVISLFNTGTRSVTPLATLNILPFWLASSPDASVLLFDQPGWQQAQLMLVSNFH